MAADCREVDARIGHITPQSLFEKMEQHEDMLLVDVRNSEEFLAGHIEGSVSIDRGILESGILTLTQDPQKVIVLYCGSGNRAALATESLMNMGFMNVMNLSGGIKGWMGSEYPVTNILGEFKMVIPLPPPEET